MANKQHRDLKIYTSLEDMPIFNFDKVLNGDMNYISTKFRKGNLPENAKSTWNKLYDEYCVLTGNTEHLFVYRLLSEINTLETAQMIIPMLLGQILKGKPKKIADLYFNELENWGFKVDKKKIFEDEFNRLSNLLRGQKNKLDRKIYEFESLTQDITNKPLTLIEQKVKLEVGLKISINTKKTNVLEWIALWKELELVFIANKKKR